VVSDTRIAILAEGTLDFHHGKTATSLLRYRPSDVVAVIDSGHAGKTTGEVLGVGGDTPICRDIFGALSHRPTRLLIGIAPRGGGLPAEWRRQILTAISNGLDVISGLHYMLNEDAQFRAAATQADVRLVDVRRVTGESRVAEMLPRRQGSYVVTLVGSDCAVGKMTAALEITACARRRGLTAAFVATGQTGIMIEGSGVAIDRVIGDFMAGAVERLVVEASDRADWVFVEGQGSLFHPAYSGVALALLHGSAPDAMILVHPPTHTTIDEYPVRIPGLSEMVRIHEEAAGWVRPSRVIGIALNTRDLDERSARRVIEDAREETGLPATDPVRFDPRELVEAVCKLTNGGSA
jgi:uncharacterized NAD-dependent epimerase/dehydratase family protein